MEVRKGKKVLGKYDDDMKNGEGRKGVRNRKIKMRRKTRKKKNEK